ncbi:hypothetical protein N656DRAFT_801341 [Canariomyces notabilis]|uniref:Uncharacterized protein n=1 Tax=Canariomyces notabilis TaxID=2074819 RepID=A0AAN6QFZ4_9PEZI|nr:hypothetical protein N656DRAFT_801341 [Canariomyces arenarius]
MPTHSRDRRSSDTQHRDSKQRQELLRQVGRAALAYCVQRMSHQDAPDSDPSHRDRRRSSRSQNRDAFTSASGSARQSETTCDLPLPPPARGDSDLHNVLSQVVAGLFSLGLRQLMHRTREARRRRRRQQQQQQAQASSSSSARVDNSNLNSGQRGAGEQVDPELSVALGSVTRELQAAADSIRRLAHTSTSGPGELHHRNCAVRAALVADADRLLRVLEEVQAGVNNMRNLHPGLRARPGTGRGESQGRGQGRGFDGAGARSGGRRARVRNIFTDDQNPPAISTE